MSEFISLGILVGLAIWGYACCRAGNDRVRKIAPEKTSLRRVHRRTYTARFLLIGILMLLSAQARRCLAQTVTSSVMPANPTYVDAVTAIVTIPASAGLGSATGMIDYTVDGGDVATATVVTGNNYVSIGQLSIGSHVLHFQTHPASPAPILPPPPVTIPVTDQSFGFVGVYGYFNSNYTDANLFSSAGLAIDSKDTVWIGDSILGKLVSFDVFGNITNIPIANLPTPIAYPSGLAFDSSDNLFIADRGNSRIVKYTPAGVETVLTTPGLGNPGQLMLDKARNLLYVIDQDNERVVRYDLTAVTLAGYPFSGLTAIQSIALDPAGNVYVSDKVAGFLENVNGVVTALHVNAPITTAGGIFIDRAGLFYLTDSTINATYRIDAQGHQTQVSDFDSSHGLAEDSHGRIYFGTSPNVRTFLPAGALGTNAATTSPFGTTDRVNSLVYTMPQGQTALNRVVSPSPTFVSDLGTEACPFVEVLGTCYFRINFAPQIPGLNVGNVATTLPGGPTISSLLYGDAFGAAPALSPGTQTPSSSGAAISAGVALDQLGNHFVSDSSTNKVFETSAGVTHELGFSGLSKPRALAVDGLSAVYVLDSGNDRIAKLDASGNQIAPVVAGTGNPLTAILSFVIDGGGQIYFAGTAGGSNSIYIYDLTGATSLIASDIGTSVSLALDPYGDVYSLQADGSLIRIDINRKQATLAAAGTFANPVGLAIDASETAYVAQSGISAITLVHPNGGIETIPVAGLDHAAGIAIDRTGSLLAVDSATNNFTFVDRTHQDFNFGDLPVGTPKTIVSFFGNVGTQPFNINQVPGDSVFVQTTSADACVTSGAAANIAPGSSCDLSYTVAPTGLGTITEYSRVATDVSVDYDTFTVNAVRTPTAPTFNPASLNFGNVNVGQTATLSLSLTNKDTAPLVLGTISLIGNYSLTSASTCKQGGTIAVGGSCSFTVQFAPTEAGEAPSSLAVQYTGGTAVANIAGTGVATPLARLTPASYNFGNVTVGATSSQLLLKFTNTGNTTLHPGNATGTVRDLHFLSIAATTCTGSSGSTIVALSQGESCILAVDFAPTTAGLQTGVVSIPSEAGNTSAAITGTGVAPTATLTPATFSFGNVTVGGKSSQLLLTLTNTSNVSLHTTGALSSSTAFPLLTTGAPCVDTTVLAPGGSCNLAANFSPTAVGAASGTVSIGSEAGTAVVTLNGIGVAPTATLTPATYNFGDVTVGTTSSQALLKFTNTSTIILHPGNATGTVPGLAFPFTPATTCTGSSGSTVVALSPGASCVLAIDFVPTVAGVRTGVVSIPSEAGMTSASISGTGIAAPLPPTLSPVGLSFGNVAVGATSAAQNVTFTNPGTFPLALTSVGVVGSGFSIQSAGTTCKTGASIPANGSCAFSIIFSPAVAGAVTGSLTVGLSPGLAVSSLSVPITGTGVAAVVSPDTIDFSGGFPPNGLTLNGAATVTGGVLQLTANQPSQASAAFYPTPVSTASFSTDFAFQLLDPLAEGITFTIQGDGPTAIGSSGGGLGFQRLAKSIALKFDLRDTAGEGTDSTGIYVDGAAPTVPAISLAASGIDLHSGDVFALHIAYDGTTEFITLTDTVTSAVWSTQVAEDIPSIVGGNTAYFGFTAGTGTITAATTTATATKTASSILTWSYAAAPAPAALSPTTLSFGNVTIGSTSALQSALLTNTGITSFQVQSITPSDPAIVIHTSFCARAVTPGNYCKIEVNFAPSAASAFSGAIVINYTVGSQNLTSTLQVIGTGVAPQASLSPASANFGSIYLTQTSPQQLFTFKNSTGSAITLTRVTIAEDNSLPFAIASGATCISNAQLPTGGSCTIPIAFTSKAAGAILGTLYVSYLDASNRAVTETSSLTGNGLVAATLTPSTMNVGDVAAGQPAGPYTFTLTNTSSIPITIGVISGAPSTTTCASSLAAGDSCTIGISFTSAALGNNSESFSVQTGAGTYSASLTANGIVPTSTLAPANTSYDFGTTTSSGFLSTDYVLNNTSDTPLRFLYSVNSGYFASGSTAFEVAIDYTGLNDSNYKFYCTVDLINGDMTIPPGGYCPLSIWFWPGAEVSASDGTYTAAVTILTDGASPIYNLNFTAKIAPSTSPTPSPEVDFSTGFTPDALTLQGPATISSGALQLTAGPSSTASSAFFPKPVSSTSFDTEATFQLLDPTAEGITFTIQGDGPNAVGTGGGGLGYRGLAKSLAIKFDLKDTAGEGVNSTGIYINGAAPTIPATDLTPYGIDLHSGDVLALGLSYDGAKLAIRLADTTTHRVWNTLVSENIPNIVGGNTAYVGFTAGSGTATPSANATELKRTSQAQSAATVLNPTSSTATSKILTWTYSSDSAIAQTIAFPSLPPVTYGAAPLTLAAKSTSGLPVNYSVMGPAKLFGSTLTITGAGDVTVSATQAGNAAFAAAAPVTGKFTVAKASLTVAANDLSRALLASNPALTYAISGFVDGDTTTVVAGTAVLTTTAVPNSPSGNYPITFTSEGLTASNYNFTYVAGSLTITPGTLAITPLSGNFGSIAVGTISPVISFTVTNHMASTMAYLGYTNLGEFYLQPGTCNLVNGEPMLKPGQSCIFTAVFKPTRSGAITGNLSFQTSSGTFNVPLTGIGSTLVISPSSGNFGNIAVGKSSPLLSFTVTNDTPATIGYLGYANLGEFNLLPGTCNLVNGEPMLKPGQSCIFTAVFKPTKPGAVSGNLSIQTSSGAFNIPMTGTGSPQ